MLTRRTFLTGVLSLVAATAVPVIGKPIPILRGDGLWDDTDGLQAAFDGLPFIVEGDAVFDAVSEGSTRINGGSFLISRNLIIRRTLEMTYATIRSTPTFQDDFMLRIAPETYGVRLSNISLDH